MSRTTPPAQDDAGRLVIIGAGPAGLMAAESAARVLLAQAAGPPPAGGLQIDVYDAMPSAGRKFLLAGRGGLNLTHAEPTPAFLSRYGDRSLRIAPMLEAFGAQALREWAHGLGIDTFVGTSQRVFPREMKAAPLLRAWLHRLRSMGVRLHMRHRWSGWDAQGRLQFECEGQTRYLNPRATVLALGGASWARLGSDGAWVPLLSALGVAVAPLVPANCGFDVAGGWSPLLRERHAGQPVKPVLLRFAGASTDAAAPAFARQGEFVLTETGIEGSLVYAASALLRDEIAARGQAVVHLDLLPDRDLTWVRQALSLPRGTQSQSQHWRKRLGLHGLKAALLHEVLDKARLADPARLAEAIKALPLSLVRPRPIDEAISTAGGLCFEALGDDLMLQARPGVFCCGEMLDWEAPTGGYLLTACMATGRRAGLGAADWLMGSRADVANTVRPAPPL